MEFTFTTLCWFWLGAGVLLTVSEFIVPGFVICFFGISAMIVSVICAFVNDLSLAWQLTWFGAISVVLLFVSRLVAPDVFKGGTVKTELVGDIDSDDIIGKKAIVKEAIGVNTAGKVEFRGTLWEAVANSDIPAGKTVIVTRRKNLTLTVTEIEGL